MASQLWPAFLLLTVTVGGVVLLFSALEPPPPQPSSPPPDGALLLTPEVDAAGCEDAEGTALLVTSHAAHAGTRAAHRRAYSAALLRSLGVRRVFLLARDDAWAAVEAEGRRFGDVVAGGFREAYRNLTSKHLMGLRWAAARCPRVAHVIKMDDDVVADLYRVLSLLRVLAAPGGALLAGYALRGAAPSRDTHSKWFVTRAEFPGDAYPDFLSGWFYITTPAAARRLVGAALAVSPSAWFWIDDVFVTGVLARAAGLRVARGDADLSPLFAADAGFLECCVAAPRFSCEFFVGPDGGDSGLQERFQKHAAHCFRVGGCPRKDVAETCVRKVEPALSPREGLLGRGGAARIRLRRNDLPLL